MEPLEAQLLLLRIAFLVASYGFVLAIGWVVWRELGQSALPTRSLSASGPRLIVLVGAGSDRPPGQAFLLSPVTALGRDLDNQVVLQDPTVSGRHAVIHHRDGAWWVEDLGSTNGTLINGRAARPLQPELLRSGDRLQLGSVQLRLAIPEL